MSRPIRKAIIAGGRDFVVGPDQRRWLDGIMAVARIDEVVSGGAPGADAGGEQWAKTRGVGIRRFSADWQKHGRAAGPKRNEEMAAYADAGGNVKPRNLCILFPGGRGTASMRECAKRHNLRVIEYLDHEDQ